MVKKTRRSKKGAQNVYDLVRSVQYHEKEIRKLKKQITEWKNYDQKRMEYLVYDEIESPAVHWYTTDPISGRKWYHEMKMNEYVKHIEVLEIPNEAIDSK